MKLWVARLWRKFAPTRGWRVEVTGDSMYPLLHPGERLLVDRGAYRASEPRRGEIVVFRRPGSAGERSVKVVVGLPGEVVSVERDRLWINGLELRWHAPVVGTLPGQWQLGEAGYFLLSYSVAVGTDSRVFGPVDRSSIEGRVTRVYAPRARARRVESLALGTRQDGED
ncbi:MAG: signal peptidase I [Chloroflexota bacterium]